MAENTPTTEDKRPFAKSVASTVTGEIKGSFIGGVVGAAIVGGLGMLAGAALAVAAPLLLSGSVTLLGVGIGAGVGLIGGSLIGGVSSAITGGLAGAVTGWVNSRPQEPEKLVQQQQQQISYAQGMVQGVALTKIEALEQQQQQHAAHHATHEKNWVQHVGGPKAENQLFVEQEKNRQAQAALLAMQPQGHS